MLCNRTGLRHRRGGPGDVRDGPRSHPQAGDPVLTTLRAPCLFLHSKVVTLRVPRLFLMQCKAEYKTHVRIEGGDESPHSKDASRRRSKRSASCRGGRSTGRKQYGKCISRFCSSDILAVVFAGVKDDSRDAKPEFIFVYKLNLPYHYKIVFLLILI